MTSDKTKWRSHSALKGVKLVAATKNQTKSSNYPIHINKVVLYRVCQMKTSNQLNRL